MTEILNSESTNSFNITKVSTFIPDSDCDNFELKIGGNVTEIIAPFEFHVKFFIKDSVYITAVSKGGVIDFTSSDFDYLRSIAPNPINFDSNTVSFSKFDKITVERKSPNFGYSSYTNGITVVGLNAIKNSNYMYFS